MCAQPKPVTEDTDLISLLGIFSSQYGSYTTLLWQVPALSLTAQAFLMTIALGHDSSKTAKIIVSTLSMVIAAASYFLMHDQRGHAINYGELAKEISNKLALKELLRTVDENDGVPATTNAESIWTWHGEMRHITITGGKWYKINGPGRTYAIWQTCMASFFFVGIGIIISSFWQLTPAILIATGLGIVTIVCIIILEWKHRKGNRQDVKQGPHQLCKVSLPALSSC